MDPKTHLHTVGEPKLSMLCVGVTGGLVEYWMRALISVHFVPLCPDVPGINGTPDCGSPLLYHPLDGVNWIHSAFI